MNTKYIGSLLFAGAALLSLSSCNDFLDTAPESSPLPGRFFSTERELSEYTITYYNFTSITPGTYGISTFGQDNNTDNQASVGYSNRWVPGDWKVPANAGNEWNFEQIHHCNYFFEQVMPKYRAGIIKGDAGNIRHYIGEMYVLRAKDYFDKLKTIGDCPILTQTLPEDRDVLMQNTLRQPRYKVARFILQDLDSAITYLKDTPPGGKNRISRDVAYLLRSRVALFEGTWLKYHKGTAFVPGGPGWGGNSADIADFNIDNEIAYFLGEAMASAKVVADKQVKLLAENTDAAEGMTSKLVSNNPYFTMFCDENMETYGEVLMWRAFNEGKGVTHNVQMQLGRNGGGSGYTRGLVNSFLMRNGLPIYATGSGYDANWETKGISATLQNRDSRIRIFTKLDNSVNAYSADTVSDRFDPSWLVKGNNETRMVTGFAIKKGMHYDLNMQIAHGKGTSGSVVFRGAEALLNYIEASYERNGTIDASADSYWRALRTRAKVDPDYTKTIAATNMSEEAKNDFGAYSHGQLVNTTLYNIRRERRNEFIAEGFRWDDLRRWRALDQVNGYQIEGMRYWGSIYEGKLLDKDGNNLALVSVADGKGNISAQSSSVYVRPYQISSVNNSVFNGYHFTPAHYLSPLAQSVFRTTTTNNDGNLEQSVVYQNPGWPKVADQGATQ